MPKRLPVHMPPRAQTHALKHSVRTNNMNYDHGIRGDSCGPRDDDIRGRARDTSAGDRARGGRQSMFFFFPVIIIFLKSLLLYDYDYCSIIIVVRQMPAAVYIAWGADGYYYSAYVGISCNIYSILI